jgi:hypothetical protein
MLAKYFRRVIKIPAEASPNVRQARAEIALGMRPSGKIVTPGVLTWDEYCHRRATWDAERQCVGLGAWWYEGPELKLFPREWLDFAQEKADKLRGSKRIAKALGIDSAEGGDSTCWAVVDEHGLIYLLSLKTGDTNEVAVKTLALMREYNIQAEMTAFDRGGGGQQHADRMRAMGHRVRTVGFGEAVSLEPKTGMRPMAERREVKEEKYTFMNRRAEMYGDLSEAFNPANEGFAAARGLMGNPKIRDSELRHQLIAIPKLYDRAGEGRLRMLPKTSDNTNDDTLVKRIGHSPDEADALALAYHAMTHKAWRRVAGVVN